jgi:hypothetical protein
MLKPSTQQMKHKVATLGLIFQTPKLPRQSKVTSGSNKKSQSDYPYEN